MTSSLLYSVMFILTAYMCSMIQHLVIHGHYCTVQCINSVTKWGSYIFDDKRLLNTCYRVEGTCLASILATCWQLIQLHLCITQGHCDNAAATITLTMWPMLMPVLFMMSGCHRFYEWGHVCEPGNCTDSNLVLIMTQTVIDTAWDENKINGMYS